MLENCPEYYRDPDVLIQKTKEYRDNSKKKNVEQIEKFIKSQSEESKGPNMTNNQIIQEEKNIQVKENRPKEETKKSIKLNPKHISSKPEQKIKPQVNTLEETQQFQNQAEANKKLEMCMKSFAETRKKVIMIIILDCGYRFR